MKWSEILEIYRDYSSIDKNISYDIEKYVYKYLKNVKC